MVRSGRDKKGITYLPAFARPPSFRHVVVAKIKYYELRLFAAQGYWPLIEEQIKKGVLFGPYHQTENIYYEALRSIAAGDSVTAAKNFNWLAANNSYF